MMSLGKTTNDLLEQEAKSRDITLQALIRSVIIPEWTARNLRPTTKDLIIGTKRL
jgi:hypothetical protein